MQIKVNGKPHILEEKTSVSGLIEQLSLNSTQVAVERNRQIVPRASWEKTALNDADEIEIVRFIGGG